MLTRLQPFHYSTYQLLNHTTADESLLQTPPEGKVDADNGRAHRCHVRVPASRGRPPPMVHRWGGEEVSSSLRRWACFFNTTFGNRCKCFFNSVVMLGAIRHIEPVVPSTDDMSVYISLPPGWTELLSTPTISTPPSTRWTKPPFDSTISSRVESAT